MRTDLTRIKAKKGGSLTLPGFKRASMLALLVAALLTPARAQIEAATLLSPWPPPGWPEGARGEVRLVGGDEDEPTSVFAFPVGDDGSVTYSLPETLPADVAEATSETLTPADLAQVRAGASAVISPPGAAASLLAFVVYADGEPWGVVEMSEEVQTGLFSYEAIYVGGLVYASQPVSVTGGGTCEGVSMRFDLTLGDGPKLLQVNVEANAASSFASIETTDRFELRQRPVAFGSE